MMGLFGFKGQAISGHRTTSVGAIIGSSYLTGTSSAATGSVTALAAGTAYIFAIGAGGKCATSGFDTAAGGGAGAAYRKMAVKRGDVFTLTAAASQTIGTTDGADSTVICPDGRIVRGGGGKAGAPGGVSGLGGVGSGGDINRSGGAGAPNGSSTGFAGEGPGAGAGGASPGGGVYGGGGSAGLGDYGDMFLGGAGGSGGAVILGGTPGGGSGSGHTNNNSGPGRAVVIIISASDQ